MRQGSIPQFSLGTCYSQDRTHCTRVHADDPEDPDDLPIASPDDDNFPPRPCQPTPLSLPTLVAVPELTHPGDSASNGLAERSVRTLDEQTRT